MCSISAREGIEFANSPFGASIRQLTRYRCGGTPNDHLQSSNLQSRAILQKKSSGPSVTLLRQSKLAHARDRDFEIFTHLHWGQLEEKFALFGRAPEQMSLHM
jgi:hypothetical protein